MEKKLSTLIVIAAIAAVLALCASVLGICALSRANALEERVSVLEAAAYAMEAIPGDEFSQQIIPEATGTSYSDRIYLTLGDWSWENSTLVLRSGNVLVDVSEAELASLALDVCTDGKSLTGCLLTAVPGEATGTMEAELSNVNFPLAEEDLSGFIDLQVTAELKNGEILTAVFNSWSYEDGSLMLISG